jgi:Holliday junction resolvase
MALEKTIVANIMDEARRLGWWCMKNHGNAYSLKGLPDILAIKRGFAAWMEVKLPGEEPTRIQLHRIRELIAAGCAATTVWSVGDAIEFLTAIDGARA